MTSLCRNLVGLLFFVLPPMHSHLFTNAASASPPITRPSIVRITDTADDYTEDYYYDSTKRPSRVLPNTRIPLQSQLCPYNPCLEEQEPCAVLLAQTGCLCPGMSGPQIRPHPPLIQALVPVSGGSDNGKIEVQWCAPSSVVSQYKIVIEGRDDDAPIFWDTSRRGLVPTLEVGTKVCVVAVNDAGSSEPSEFSCKRYEAQGSPDHTLLACIIGGGATLLLLIVIVALICGKCQKFRKGKRDSTDGFL